MRNNIAPAAVVAALALPATVLGVPEVTAVKLSNGCASYPKYSNATGTAGTWSVRADATGQSFDGNSASVEAFTNDGVDRFGFISVKKQPPRTNQQNTTFRCTSSHLQASLPAAQFYPDPNAALNFVDLVISTEENWQSSMGFNLNPSIPVEPYAHYWPNGTRLSGVFLGAQGRTEWFFKHNWGGNAGEYYLMRLKGETKEDRMDGMRSLRKRQDFPVLDDRDFTGWLRVVG